MTWGKVCDGFHAHPKARKAGLAACGLWALALSHCNAYMTDGHVSRECLTSLAGDASLGEELAARLVTAKLWHLAEEACPHPLCRPVAGASSLLAGASGWRFHKWAKHQPSRAKVEAERERKIAAGRAGGLQKAANRSSLLAGAKPPASPELPLQVAPPPDFCATPDPGPDPIEIQIPPTPHDPPPVSDVATVLAWLEQAPEPVRFLAAEEHGETFAERFAAVRMSGSTLGDIREAIEFAGLKCGKLGKIDPESMEDIGRLADHVGGCVASNRRINRSRKPPGQLTPVVDRFLGFWAAEWAKAEKGTYVLGPEEAHDAVTLVTMAEKHATDEAVRTCVDDPEMVVRILAHWVRCYLRDEGAGHYLAAANHPLRYLPRQVSSYGLPKAKNVGAASGPKPPDPPPRRRPAEPLPPEFGAVLGSIGAGPTRPQTPPPEPIERRRERNRLQAAALIAEEARAMPPRPLAQAGIDEPEESAPLAQEVAS